VGFKINPCPHCGHNDCYDVTPSDKRTGFHYASCFSCEATDWIPDDEVDSINNNHASYVPKGLVEVNNVIEIDAPSVSDPYVPDIYRGITKATMERCNVYFTRNLTTDKESVHYHYPDEVKHRKLPKDITVSGPLHHFWGHDEATGGKLVLITEGEEDRMSAIQMLGDVHTLSLPNATPSKQFWENAKAKLANYQKIVVSADSDEAGEKVAKKIYTLYPGKVYIMDHGKYKDANDFLEDGAIRNYRDSFWNAQRLKPETILGTAEDFISLFNQTPDYEYFPTGIQDLDYKMLGIHKGALTVVLAETGIGKTEFFRYLEWQCFKHKEESGKQYKFAMCHGEETQLRSILGLFSYYKGQNLTRKDLVEAGGYQEEYNAFVTELTKDERVYQFSVRVDEGIDEIISQVRFLTTALGVDFIFLEPIQDFVYAVNTSEKESLLTDLTNKLKRLAPELDVGIVIIAHSNKEGEAKYAASIVQGAAYEIRLSRDTDAVEEEERNTMNVEIGRKNRTGGGSGPAGELAFDLDTYMLTTTKAPSENSETHMDRSKT